MFLHPLSECLGYTAPDGKGVYVLPATEAVPNGWGEPRRNDEGGPISPGTPGGAFPKALIWKKGGGFKSSSTKYFQMAGNITWWGNWRNAQKQSKGKQVLSYHGPKLRYFKEDGFEYGSAETHEDIYYLGSYASVAPGPVAGACMRKITYYDAATDKTQESTFLYVVVARKDKDEFYRKRWNFGLVPGYKMNDTIRSAQKKLFDAKDNPTGWQKIGDYAKPSDDHFPTETPWFFNKSGTEAVHMRRKRITFNNGQKDITEDAFDRIKLTVSEESASAQNLGNLPAMQYEEKITKEHPTHVSTDHEGYSHTWQEDHVKVEIKLDGAQYVLGDYIEDELQWGKVKYKIVRSQRGYYTEGTDPPTYNITYEGNNKNISNAGLRQGPKYHDFYEYNYWDTDYVPSEADHEFTFWVIALEEIDLYYGPESNPEAKRIELHQYVNGTSDEWEGNPRQENNPILYYYSFATRFFRAFLDIRKMAYFSQKVDKYGLWQNATTAVDRTVKYADMLVTDTNTKGEKYKEVKQASQEFSSFMWTVAEMDEWDDTIDETLNRTTYTGKWPDDNHEGEVQVPGNQTFYASDTTGDVKEGWPDIPTLLYGESAACKGNGVRTDTDAICFSVEVPDVEQEGKYVLLSDHKTGGKPAAIVKYGEKFYPVSAC